MVSWLWPSLLQVNTFINPVSCVCVAQPGSKNSHREQWARQGPTQCAPASRSTSLGTGRSGLGFWFPTLPLQTPRKAWKQVGPCNGLGAPKSTGPPNTHQLEPLYLKRTQAQRCCRVVQPPPTRGPGGSGKHRRRVAHTEIPGAVGWREVEPVALKWLPLARPWPGRALGSGMTQRWATSEPATVPSPGWAAGPRAGPCPLSALSISAPWSTIPLPGSNLSPLVPIPAPWFWSLFWSPSRLPGAYPWSVVSARPRREHRWMPPSPARFPGAGVDSEGCRRRRQETLTC